MNYLEIYATTNNRRAKELAAQAVQTMDAMATPGQTATDDLRRALGRIESELAAILSSEIPMELNAQACFLRDAMERAASGLRALVEPGAMRAAIQAAYDGHNKEIDRYIETYTRAMQAHQRRGGDE